MKYVTYFFMLALMACKAQVPATSQERSQPTSVAQKPVFKDFKTDSKSYYAATLHKRANPGDEAVISGKVWTNTYGEEANAKYAFILFTKREPSVKGKSNFTILREEATDTLQKNGNFQLKVKPGQHSVEIGSMGYKTAMMNLKLNPQDSLHLDVYLIVADPITH